MIAFKIIPLCEELVDISEKIVNILNENQDAFKYDFICDTTIIEQVKDISLLHTDQLYPYFEELRIRMQGYNPNIMGITNRRLANSKYDNLFGDLEKYKGISLGNGVVTTFQVKEMIKEIPIEAYFLYELILYPLLIITRTNLFHDEVRVCPFDRKLSKIEIYKVLKHSTLCIQCSSIIKKYLNRFQLNSMRRVFPLIDDLSNGQIEISALIEREKEDISKPIERISLDQIKTFIGQDNLGKAIDDLADYLELNKSNYRNEVIILRAQFSSLNRQERMQTTTSENLNIEKGRIRIALLEIVNNITKN